GPALAAVAYAEWDESTPDAATYYVTARSGTGWTTTEYGTAGPRLGYTDTANYIAGMAFPNPCIDDRVAVARQVDGLSSVDMYVGDTSTQLAASATTRLARPAFPINGDPTRVIASDVSYYGASYTDYASDIVALFDDTGSDVVTSGTQQVTILCGELRTGRILSTVPVSAASWEQVHRDAGSIEITVPVTSAEVQAMPDLLSCLEGPAFYLAVQKGEQIMEAGPIWAWSYDGVSSLRVAAAGLWSLWDHRKVMKVLASGENPAETSLGWSGLSLATLAKRLIVSAMAHTGGSLPVVLPADIVGTSEREWPGYQLATVADEVRAIMGVIGGPDVAFEPRLTPDNLSIEWVMRTGTTSAPLLHQSGSDWQWDTTVVRGGAAGLSVDRDWSSMTMRGWAVGEGQDEASLMSMRQDLTLTDAGYPLLEQDQSFTSVSVQSTLDRHAEAVVAANRRAWQTWGMTVEADEVPRPGDWCRVWISKSHPVLGRLARSAPYYRARLLKVSGDLTDFVKLTMAPTMDAR
ncbi:hypothetical protein, partial [Actinotalea sp.]|uniref:hypothetical protein n=1 Tax=Actinotalea sp. TaxID=1872145 RepID=UPI0035651182